MNKFIGVSLLSWSAWAVSAPIDFDGTVEVQIPLKSNDLIARDLVVSLPKIQLSKDAYQALDRKFNRLMRHNTLFTTSY